MNYVSDIMYWISTGLLVPVVVLLIFFFGRSLLLIGSFFGQYLAIRRTSTLISKELEMLNRENIHTLIEKLPQKNQSLVVIYMQRLLNAKDNIPLRQRLLSDFDIEAEKDLSVSKTLGKMGPMLGLMGTLIPMGPALVGLSAGDIASMAYNMQVAFATTVIGLFAAGIGYVTQSVKQRWYLQDLTNLEFVAGLLNENEKKNYEA
ncbi:MAG: MotA/TolQ/ExbB proton channel family protein [Bacteroidaceae bacterium]|nr:MotA/TolQ/ExbB proton channel family protein [Bacteroidaceae bacterium]